jgi:hypothetical protein
MPPMRKKNIIEVTNSTTETSNDETSISNIMQAKANNTTKETKNKDDYCKELKNIAYKTMLLNGQEIVPEINNTSNNILSNFLENESCANKKENWSKDITKIEERGIKSHK